MPNGERALYRFRGQLQGRVTHGKLRLKTKGDFYDLADYFDCSRGGRHH
jgi:hypothetical protein